ncbi:MAG: peptidoglycan bridge formation glycyltransferase FemA/FemB family protein [Candidatus Pacebacteria bacterium]|nr:peptidoglycan bridge formation glycyltransferase FemA/FemB family protein [Candidatus Paceibacterota bacterium]
MEFLEIGEDKKDDWNSFLLQNSPESFLQSFEWGEFQKAVGRKIFRFAVFEHGKLLAISSAIEHKLPLGLKYWYLPRGPIAFSGAGDAEQSGILDFFMKSLRAKAKSEGAAFVRMDPAAPKSEQNVWNGLDMKNIEGSVQPKDTLVLDIRKSEEGLLGEMKPKTRYNIRLAEKKGVEAQAEDFSEKNFMEFWELMRETLRRDGITSHDRGYYLQMLQVLGAENSVLKGRLYFAKFEGQIIAANIVLFFGTYAVYLHGASSNNFRNLMAPYLLQWRQILDAKDAGCQTYDFWGITVDNENPKWAGITRFKKGFGGEEISYAGVYDLPINNFLYKLYRGFRKNR